MIILLNNFLSLFTNALNAEKGIAMGDHYKLLPADLRDINSLDRILKQANFDTRCDNITFPLEEIKVLLLY